MKKQEYKGTVALISAGEDTGAADYAITQITDWQSRGFRKPSGFFHMNYTDKLRLETPPLASGLHQRQRQCMWVTSC